MQGGGWWALLPRAAIRTKVPAVYVSAPCCSISTAGSRSNGSCNNPKDRAGTDDTPGSAQRASSELEPRPHDSTVADMGGHIARTSTQLVRTQSLCQHNRGWEPQERVGAHAQSLRARKQLVAHLHGRGLENSVVVHLCHHASYSGCKRGHSRRAAVAPWSPMSRCAAPAASAEPKGCQRPWQRPAVPAPQQGCPRPRSGQDADALPCPKAWQAASPARGPLACVPRLLL